MLWSFKINQIECDSFNLILFTVLCMDVIVNSDIYYKQNLKGFSMAKSKP